LIILAQPGAASIRVITLTSEWKVSSLNLSEGHPFLVVIILWLFNLLMIGTLSKMKAAPPTGESVKYNITRKDKSYLNK
jgi:hypothetical protein